MHGPGALARRGGQPARKLATPRRTDGLCSFCLPSFATPLLSRADDSAGVCTRGGWGGGGGSSVRQCFLQRKYRLRLRAYQASEMVSDAP